MKFEKLILSFFAILGGLIVAGVGFFIYQSTKKIPPSEIKTISISQPTPTSTPVLLALSSPADQSVTDNKIVTISGKTDPNATIIISTDSSDQVISPASTGDFTTTIAIDSDENVIHILAINKNGEETEKIVTVTYSTQNF